MRIYWRALFGYGFVFWIVLCLTDILGISNFHRYKKELNDLYENPSMVENIEKNMHRLEYKGIKFGWSLLIWNTFTFVISVLICSGAKLIVRFCWSKKLTTYSKLLSPHLYRNSSSKIPVKIRRSSEINFRQLNKHYRINLDTSCPNLMKRSESNLSTSTEGTARTCRTLFRKDVFICDQPDLSSVEQLENQCKKLAQELQSLQTTSLKEHAALSRKLDTVLKDRNEQSKQLVVSKKDCRAANQQVQELLQEKAQLLKKLENASKEFRSHTKTKNFAINKLEEATNNMEELRHQLEQVSRDKEILEKKLKLLETEYNKLHERFITTQQTLYNRNSSEDLPEKDENNGKTQQDYLRDLKHESTTFQQAAEVLVSVSQTEIDVKTIQEKIKQLEKNLENLNQDNLECSENMDQLASELSLSGMGSDSKKCPSSANYSSFSSSSTPRANGYWSDKVADLIERNKCQFQKIHDLAVKMHEKTPFFGNNRIVRIGSAESGVTTTDSESGEPKRLVSSSVAFQNFLKSINNMGEAKKEQSSSIKVYF